MGVVNSVNKLAGVVTSCFYKKRICKIIIILNNYSLHDYTSQQQDEAFTSCTMLCRCIRHAEDG